MDAAIFRGAKGVNEGGARRERERERDGGRYEGTERERKHNAVAQSHRPDIKRVSRGTMLIANSA